MMGNSIGSSSSTTTTISSQVTGVAAAADDVVFGAGPDAVAAVRKIGTGAIGGGAVAAADDAQKFAADARARIALVANLMPA